MQTLRIVRRGFSFTYPCPRKLREIMKVSLIEREPVQTIKNIWHDYHEARTENISHTIDKDEYEILKKHSKRAPMFMLPIKRHGGHFKLLSQAQNDSILFTYLEDFKRHGGSAPPYFVLTMFPELLYNKGIVLVRGDILSFKLTKPEAQNLTKQMSRAYLNSELFEMMEHFNHDTSKFNIDRYNELYQL